MKMPTFDRLVPRCVLAFFALDALFNPLVMMAFLSLFAVEDAGTAGWVLPLLVVGKIAANSAFLAQQLAPYERLVRRPGGTVGENALVAADRTLQLLPKRFGVFYAWSWSVTYALAFLSVHTWSPSGLSERAIDAAGLLVAAVWLGGFAFGFPLIAMLTTEASNACSIVARQRGIALERDPIALEWRIGVVALSLGLGPTLWMMALGYMNELGAAQEVRNMSARLGATELARAANAGEPRSLRFSEAVTAPRRGHEAPRTAGMIAGPDLRPLAVAESAVRVDLPARARSWLASETARSPSGIWSPRDGDLSVAFERVDRGRVAIASVQVPVRASMSFVASAGVFAIIVAIWAPLCAVILARAVSGPIQRLTRAAREIVEEGKQSEMGVLPVARNDEIGILTERFNDLLDMMRDLGTAADAIARGDLRITVQGTGELPDAFRSMLESLRSMVHQIAETSVELGSAATEIFAASQEQEAAAASQSSAMEEISRTMDSLSESAAHVSDAVRGVLSNAERTLENTDAMVRRITELSAHAGRIAEILEVIREIADKSDLLALNGSLEANRAGEQGYGFSLVAGEMRRLAERVTASVQDVKRLVTDIRESGTTTVMATEESRRLAQGTTEAARQITFVTQQQRSGTEQVSQSVKSIADVVTQAVSATAQTRTSAERLKTQADRLNELVRTFETPAKEAA